MLKQCHYIAEMTFFYSLSSKYVTLMLARKLCISIIGNSILYVVIRITIRPPPTGKTSRWFVRL
jgi:hypothetical protein